MLKDIDQVLDYIFSFINLENRIEARFINNEYSLDNVIKLFRLFGNPERDKKIIHIAGTKGKGSSSLMISGLLNRLGHSTATFLSPHLVKTNERLQYNLEPISDEQLISLTNRVKGVLEGEQIKPTTFELLFLLFMLFGEEQGADYFVVETGLGGRLDTTNIVEPLICLISAIGYDHTNILGNTIEQIAAEKGGIIKTGRPVVIGRQIYDCNYIFSEIADERGAELFDLAQHSTVKEVECVEGGLSFSFNFDGVEYKDFFLPLLGRHQIDNFLAALLTVSRIDGRVKGLLLEDGRFDCLLPGRVQLLESEPPLILDVSHNKESAEKLAETLKAHYPGQKWHILTGMASDKDYKSFYPALKDLTKSIIVTRPLEYKSSKPEEIASFIEGLSIDVRLIPERAEAFRVFLELEGARLVTGSFYISGPFLEMINNSY